MSVRGLQGFVVLTPNVKTPLELTSVPVGLDSAQQIHRHHLDRPIYAKVPFEKKSLPLSLSLSLSLMQLY